MKRPLPADLRVVDWNSSDEFYRARGAWQSWMRTDKALSPMARLAGIEISDRIGFDRNGAWPSQAYIGARLGVSERTARSAVGELLGRTWFIARRGGFEGSDGKALKTGQHLPLTYLMAVSARVLREVLQAEKVRVSLFKEARIAQLNRQRIADLLLEAQPEENFLFDRKKLAGPAGRNLPVLPEENCRIISPVNRSSDSFHGITTDPLGETAQEEALRHQSLSMESFHSLLGDGAPEVGKRRGARLGSSRVAFLISQVEQLGAVGASEQIREAAAIADAHEKAGARRAAGRDGS